MKILKTLRERFSQKPVFSIQEIKKYTDHPAQLIYYLLKRGEIVRITKGYYTFIKDVMVVGEAFSPYYYGLHSALAFYNLTEQEVNPVVITPRKVRPGRREFLGRNYIVRRINRRMFFGYSPHRYYDFYIYVSDYEKTLIDFVYFREPLREEEKRSIIKMINRAKLDEYLRFCPRWLRDRVDIWINGRA